MLNGETINSGASDVCPDCNVHLELQVLRSNAGYYIGTQCDCGPYTRESGYFPNREVAEKMLEIENKSFMRDDSYNPGTLEIIEVSASSLWEE